MMMNRCKILFFLFIAVSVVAACSKGGALAEEELHVPLDLSDSTLPVVEIHSPSDNEVFTSGDTIKVEGKVTDNGLYRGSIRITDDADSTLIKEQLYEIHGLQLYNFNLAYKTTVTVVTNYTITVQYEDHGLNNSIKTVKVKVNP
jgi:hypothetical protein